VCDLEVLIHAQDVPAAAAALAGAGWRATLQVGPDQLPFFALSPGLHTGQAEFQLHWKPFRLDCPAEIEEQFHRRALPCEVGEVPARAPGSTDMLLSVCFHSRKLHPQATSRWVMDALTLIGRSGPHLDWTALVARAQAAGVLPLLREPLEYLRGEFSAPVPDTLFQRSALVSANAAPSAVLAPQPNTLRGRIRWHCGLYALVARSRGDRPTPLRFLYYHFSFMPLIWGLRRRWHLLPRMLLAVSRMLLVLLGVRRL
jgi:hypothetical protein